MTTVHVAGTGSFAAEIAEYAADCGLEVAGLVELMDAARVGERRHGLPVVGAGDGGGPAVVGAGGDRLAHWALLAPHGWSAATLVHPRSHVSASARVGEGCVVGPLAVVGAETELEPHALLGRGALVGHHVTVGAGCVVNPGANVAGHARLGSGATIGMGAVVLDHLTIGERAVVAAGAVVVRDVEPGVRVQGVPARRYAAAGAS